MSVMNYVSSEIKIIAVKHSLVGTESLNQSAARFGVSRSTLYSFLFPPSITVYFFTFRIFQTVDIVSYTYIDAKIFIMFPFLSS